MLYKRLFLIALLTSLIGLGQLWCSGNGFKVISSSSDHLKLSYTVPSWSYENQESSQGGFCRLEVPGYLWQTEIGKPALPMLRRIVAIPEGAQAVLNATELKRSFIDMSEAGINHPVIPSQPEYARIDTPETMTFQIDSDYYRVPPRSGELTRCQKTSYDMFKVTELGYMRNLRLIAVDFSPFVYDPVAAQLLLSEEVELDIYFAGANRAAQAGLDSRYYSPAYEPVFQNFVVNHETVSPRNYLLRAPMSYLILSPPSFVEIMQPFAEWKRREGYKVTIKTVGTGADIENNSTAIKNWMQQSWNNATPENPAFSFVLIVGDTPQITWSASYEYQSSGVWYQTDRNFFLLQGNDSIPEMYWGRFSATTTAQLQTVVNKTIQYQQMTMPDNSYLARAALIAGPDYDQGIPQTTPVTNNQVLYATYYFNAENGFDAQAWYSPDSHNQASSIVSRINQGNALVSYTGHGLESRWDGPVISSTGSNLNKHGIVIGNACLTSTINSTTSYGESWLRSGSGGAVAYIGASCYSIWAPDFYWAVGTYNPSTDGVYDALFHSYGQPYNQWAGTVGAMVFIGNMAVEVGSSSWAPYYWAIYNIVGDPSTIPYMGIPQTNPAQYPEYLIAGVDQFLNISGSTPGTLASLYASGTPVSGITDASGTVQLDLASFAQPGSLRLTLSAHHYQPRLEQINLLAATANPILVDYNKSGSSARTVTPGESYSIDIEILNLGAQPTGSLSLLLSSTDPYLQINQGTVTLPSMGINQAQDVASLFDLQVLPHAPNNHQISAALSMGGGQTYQLVFTVNRPPSQPWVAVEEDFESGQVHQNPVVGWSQVQVSGNNQWLADGVAGFQGGTCAVLQGIASSWAYKQVELTGGRPYKLRFRYRSTTATSTNYRIQFCASNTPPSSSATWGTELYNANVANTAWQLFNGTATFTPPVTGVYYFGFRGNLINFSTNFMYVDDVFFLYEEDLSVQSISIGTDDVIAGETLTINSNVRNNAIPVTNKVVSLWINGNLTDTYTIASLASNATLNVSFSFPSPGGQNSYQVSVPIDSNPANNQQSTAYFSFPATYTTQSFEDSLNPPAGWSFDTTWSVKNTSVNRYHGNNYAVMDNANVAQTDRRIRTAVLFRQPTDKLRFYYKTYNSPNSRLQYSYDGNTWITLRQLTNTSQVWTRHELSASELPAPHTGIWYLAVCSTTGSGTHYTFLDKFIFEPANTSAPSLQINPNTVSFGDVPLGNVSPPQSITVTNTGGSALVISGAALQDQFAGFVLAAQTLPVTLYTQDSVALQVSFNAQIQGFQSTQLQIQSSLGNQAVALSAYGWMEPTLASWTSEVAFPDTPVGSSNSFEVIFYNSGDGILSLDAGDIYFPLASRVRDPQVFQISDNNVYPLNLGHMQQASVVLSFNPLQPVTYSDGLVFEREGQALLTIPVYGTGTASALDTPQALMALEGGFLYLKWHPVPNASSYIVQQSQTPDGGFTIITEPDYYLENSLFIMPLTTHERGFYRIIAVD